MIDRRQIKAEARGLTRSAQVSALAMTALLLAAVLALQVVDALVSGDTYASLLASGPLGIFVSILVNLLSMVLQAGFILYCMAVRRGERAEFLALLDGFSFVGRLILLYLLEYLFVFLWSMLLFIPGLIAAYRYRFAVYNLCENPDLSPLEAIRMSKLQTNGYKLDLFMLDLSFLGWTVLASLPYAIVNGMALEGYTLPLSAVVTTVLCGVVSGVVNLWRLPYQTLTTLGYFEVCKTTSGVGAGMGGPNGPLPTGGDGGPFDRF